MLSFQSQLPQQAVNPINNIVHSVRSGESNSIKQSLEFFQKDRKNNRETSNDVLLSNINKEMLKVVCCIKIYHLLTFIFMRETISGWRIKVN